jgi:glycosyltransferase involved in cell wall biosynthesis
LSNVLLIPAYRPGTELPQVVRDAAGQDFCDVVVVDDGSGPGYAGVFAACAAKVLRHPRNLGKGAALRTGMAHILSHYPDCGVVTADADGQHHPEDIRRVAQRLAQEPQALVLGSRGFDNGVPGRSRAGNLLSSAGFRLLMGQKLRDTQTGLRGIPCSLLNQLVSMNSSGYEFEVDMLTAAKHLSIPIREEPIRTIYEPGNPTSHFNPLKDSMRIGFVLARFTMLSLGTAMLDNLIFSLAIGAGAAAAFAQILGRAAAVLVNYPLARRAVFLSKEPHSSTLLRYLTLVTASGLASFQLLNLFRGWFGLGVLDAKMAAEAALFIVNFLVQRDWVFMRRSRVAATDWDGYYRSPAPTAHVTRKYTSRVLIQALRRFGGDLERLVEFGGANSCFLEKIATELSPREYHVVDTNAYGLALLRGRGVTTHLEDCRTAELSLQADAAFSIGLIEHFDPTGTRDAILAHFRFLKPGGCAIISFPTPTRLYRVARWLAESVGAWKFPDERPLGRAEVVAAVGDAGRVEFEKVLWPIVFTQRLMVFRKPS